MQRSLVVNVARLCTCREFVYSMILMLNINEVNSAGTDLIRVTIGVAS